MGDQYPPTITSFVIRFVIAEAGGEGAERAPAFSPYRGSIHHVQSDETLHFGAWQDAVEFIRRYVPLESQEQE